MATRVLDDVIRLAFNLSCIYFLSFVGSRCCEGWCRCIFSDDEVMVDVCGCRGKLFWVSLEHVVVDIFQVTWTKPEVRKFFKRNVVMTKRVHALIFAYPSQSSAMVLTVIVVFEQAITCRQCHHSPAAGPSSFADVRILAGAHLACSYIVL